MIAARLLEGPDALAEASTEVGAACNALRLRGIVARAAVFTSTSPGEDISRLAIEQDVDLVLVADRGQLDDPEVTALLLRALCAVAVAVAVADAVGPEATAGAVLVPFGAMSTTGVRSSSGPGLPRVGR